MKRYVSREMALDAGDPSMEGSLYSDDGEPEWEPECICADPAEPTPDCYVHGVDFNDSTEGEQKP